MIEFSLHVLYVDDFEEGLWKLKNVVVSAVDSLDCHRLHSEDWSVWAMLTCGNTKTQFDQQHIDIL